MNKAVLISIQPKWCELIASGKKTVEVRKTKPKLETPFKCYIYATKDNSFAEKTLRGFDENGNAIYYKAHKGKVIGEFVCDNIGYVGWFRTPDDPLWVDMLYGESCLTSRELYEYSKGGNFYEWHISDLVIYDKPKELSEFSHPCDGNCQECQYALWQTYTFISESKIVGCTQKVKAPQSWCYVEEVIDEQAD